MPASSPRVTVVTPAYNVAEYIEEAITSVRSQTFADFEYFIVDDASTDATIDRAQKAAEGDSRITVVTVPNGGSGAARNTGIARGTAPYVAFIDGDDRWHPTYLETMVKALDAAPATVGGAFAHSYSIDQYGNRIAGTLEAPAGIYDINRIFSNNNPPGNGSVVMVRRTCFEEAGGFDEQMKSAVDHEMWLRVCARSSSPTFLCVPSLLVDYRKRPSSVSTEPAKRADAYVTLLSRYGDVLTPKQAAKAKLYPALLALRSDNRKALGRKWVLESLRTAPIDVLKSPHGRTSIGLLLGARPLKRTLRKLRIISTSRPRSVPSISNGNS